MKTNTKKSLIISTALIVVFTLINWLFDRNIGHDLLYILPLSLYMVALIGAEYQAQEDYCASPDDGYGRHPNTINETTLGEASEYITSAGGSFYHQDIINYAVSRHIAKINKAKIKNGVVVTINLFFICLYAKLGELREYGFIEQSPWYYPYVFISIAIICFLVFFFSNFRYSFPSKSIIQHPYPDNEQSDFINEQSDFIKVRYYWALSKTIRLVDQNKNRDLYPSGFYQWFDSWQYRIKSFEDWITIKTNCLPTTNKHNNSLKTTYSNKKDWDDYKTFLFLDPDDEETKKTLSYIQIIEFETSERFSGDMVEFIKDNTTKKREDDMDAFYTVIWSVLGGPIGFGFLYGLLESVSHRFDVAITAFAITYSVLSVVYIFL